MTKANGFLLAAATIALLAGASAYAAVRDPARALENAPASGDLPVQNVSLPPAALLPAVDPIALYGGDLIFDVYRKGKKVGEHSLAFSRDAIGDVTVKANFHIAIDVLFIKAYTFDYASTEIWRDKQVVSMAATADDNGKVTRTLALQEEGVFRISGSRGPVLASSWVFPTNHWNRGQVESSVILNTLTGRLINVKVEDRGVETVETGRGAVQARRFAYTGELHDTDAWYDAAGRWVKMRFKAKDGSYIEHICRRCGPTSEG